MFDWLKNFLEKLDYYRDRLLFLFIKPYWPRKIIPNHITYVRIVVGIILFVLLFFFNVEDKLLIVGLFILGVITDLLDGSVARGLDKVTEFGAMLDPTADRILILPIAVYSLYGPHKWLLLALLASELLNAWAALYYKSKAIYKESNIFGKTKMVLMCIVFVAILIEWPDAPSVFFIDLLWISLIFSLSSIGSRIFELKNRTYDPKNI